ncbi:hypothetical protein KDW_17500 [Dictyobacter vulcani]|uniref:Helix-turn-helix domain-containing protein n=1 Tax=Dictyobacter vulcani TaxID=2607529 RepID=A0A5J4KEC5_9CHLR|nr:helix-turn-helix domain-containing protein [Dictyobacter vulcani]GER87588.1 hypothetical protein KDW_17500 [Dictyobacter vulcani]
MPRIETPKGYYTATEVKKILNISDAMVRAHVQKGRIKYLLPPGRKQGFYLQKDVDKLSNELDAFLNLEEEVESTEFVSATEADIPGCVKLNRELFTVSVDTDNDTLVRKWTAWLQKNPDIIQILKRNNEVVGIVTMLPFKPKSEKFNNILTGDVSILLGDIDILPDDIEAYTPGNHILLYIAEIGVKPSLSKDLRRKYGAKIISNFMDSIVNLGRNGVIIEKIVSVGESKSGVRLLQHFGFSEIIFSRSDTRVFELDPKKSGAPIMNAYREMLKQSTSTMH